MLTKNGDTTGESVSDDAQQIVLEGLEGIGGKEWSRTLYFRSYACCRKVTVPLLATTVQVDHGHTELLSC